MSKAKSRLDDVEASLTPKQSVILWMEEAHQFSTMGEHVDSLLGGPDTAWPMYRLPNQVAEATAGAVMRYPDIYRNRHGPRYDVFVQVILPPGREHRYSHRVIDDEGKDQKGRSLLQCLDRQPGSHAPWQMWVNPDAPGGTVKETET